MTKPKVTPSSHISVIVVLPLILNNLVTPMAVILSVSLTEFLNRPSFYIYSYGFVLWSLYHVFLALLVCRFLRREGESLKDIVGPLKGKEWSSITLVLGLVALSFVTFQVAEPIVSKTMYGSEIWEQFLKDFKRAPLGLVLYGILVTSLTAGICEEIVWRGYLQTRLERRFGGRVWIAVTAQAALFGLWHSISVHTLFTAVFGFIFGLTYAKTGKLTPIMISHWLGDVIGFSTMYFAAV